MAQGTSRQGGTRDDRPSRNDRRDDAPGRDAPTTRPKAVYALTERGDKTFWTRVGIAFVNRDDSITIKLEALPVSGQLQVRDVTTGPERPRNHRDHRGPGPPAENGRAGAMAATMAVRGKGEGADLDLRALDRLTRGA